MSRTDIKNPHNNIQLPLMKVNELINSIFAMSQHEIVDQLQTCSKIVSQLLQNQLVNHLSSIAAAKLLNYQLILLIAEENAADSKPRLSVMENTFGNNKKIRLTASLRNTLASMSEILEEMIWKNAPKRRGGTQKNIIENSPLYEDYVEFKHLLADFDQQLEEDSEDGRDCLPKSSSKKKQQPEESSDSQENEALIQQLEEIVAKKQRRIKQLNQQLQENILEQKAQQDLISELESRNVDLKEQIKHLNMKLAQKDTLQINLQQKIEQLRTQNVLHERQVYSRKPITKTEKTIKTRFTLDDEDEPSTTKKEYKDIFEERQQICPQCQAKKDISIEDVNSLRRILLTQAMSIQALI